VGSLRRSAVTLLILGLALNARGASTSSGPWSGSIGDALKGATPRLSGPFPDALGTAATALGGRVDPDLAALPGDGLSLL
jgi:hypothetical protein